MERVNSPIDEGLAYHQAGRLADAERVYRQILAREPNHPDALHLLGVIATQVRQYDHAVRLITAAIAIKPDVAFYHNNLGNAQRALADIRAAESSYRRALELDPRYADAQVNLGTVLRDMARFEESAAAYERAIQMKPALGDAHASLGTVLKDQGRIDEALAAYRRAIQLDPTHVSAHSNLLYTMHDSDRVTPDEILTEHRRWGTTHADPLTRAARPHDNDRTPDRRLRIGYVSPDLRDHPVSRFLWPLLEHRDREQFEIVCFSGNEVPDEVTARYRAAADEWHDTAPLGDAQLADLIRGRRIDILVDLAGHTSGSRLLTFARRPAPVQMTYLGYPDTTGMAAINVRITDSLSDPPGAETRHTERLARIESCFLCYPLPADLPPISPSPARASGHVTFGSFNNLAKISPTTVRLWTQVLNAVPDAGMIIKTTRLGDEGTRRRATGRFKDLGMPMDRVELLGPQRTPAEHLAMYRRIDVALDTFPYNGTTTTCEALSMGVPIVSLAGEHHASRVGLSLLSAVGQPVWAANDPAGFAQAAQQLARDLPDRATLREQLRRSPLCDTVGFARKIERIFREEWIRWCRG
jgi:predicted O-linked N-acetylglucosamine transferase (SPINDLY family)